MAADPIQKSLNNIERNTNNLLISCGFQQITVSTNIQYLTVPSGAKSAVMVLQSDAIGVAARILQNRGTAVTSSVGVPIFAGAVIEVLNGNNLLGFQIIKDQAGTTILNCEFFI